MGMEGTEGIPPGIPGLGGMEAPLWGPTPGGI